MPAPLHVRPISEGEWAEANQALQASRGRPRLRRRFEIVLLALQGLQVAPIAETLGVDPATARLWIKRFNKMGLDGLRDKPRPGRPPVYGSDEVREVVTVASANPQTLGLPFARWTAPRLASYLQQTRGIPIKRTLVGEIMSRAGCRRRRTVCGGADAASQTGENGAAGTQRLP